MSHEAEGSLRAVAVVITRSREQNAKLRELLESRGAQVVSVPTLRFVAVPSSDTVRERLLAHGEYSHLIFTSQTAVEFFAKACGEAGVPPGAWSGAAIAAVGPATARAVEEHGWSASLVTEGTGETLAGELISSGSVTPGSHILLPRSAIARPELESAIVKAGARVSTVSIYDTATERPECAEPFLARMKKGAPPDAVLFASPSAVRAFLELTGDAGGEFLACSKTRIISIGPTTSDAVRKRGYEVSAEADPPGVEGLVRALEESTRLPGAFCA